MNAIKKVTVYGMGLIGAGWITHLLIKGGTEITAYDLNREALDRGIAILEKNMQFLIQKGILTEQDKNERIAGVHTTISVEEAVLEADLIIENGPEVMEIKQQIIASIEEFCRDDAIITTSTSGLLISGIVEKAKHPERILGAHPYHPVYLLPLLEMIRNEKTEDRYIDQTMSFFRSIDKKPVLLKKESDGYIGSRLMTTLLREAVHMVVEGICTVEDIDDAFTYGPGMRYALFGIFTTLQLGGGEGGFEGMMLGPIGKSTDKWLNSFADWHCWPEEAKTFFAGSQEQVNSMLSDRDAYHGQDNAGLEKFRDEGLARILQIHHMLPESIK